MRSWGVWCLILGVGGFILPMLGVQFVILSIFGEAEPIVAGLLAVAGLIMVIAGRNNEE